MKKEYVKPTLLVLATEPSQIMVGSPGSEGGEDIGWGTGGENVPGGNPDEGDADDEGGSLSKGGLWDEYTW